MATTVDQVPERSRTGGGYEENGRDTEDGDS